MRGIRVINRLSGRIAALTVTCLFATSAPIPATSTKSGLATPEEARLRAAVTTFYTAWKHEQWSKVFRLMAPDIQRCATLDDLTRDLFSYVKIRSWKVSAITSE